MLFFDRIDVVVPVTLDLFLMMYIDDARCVDLVILFLTPLRICSSMVSMLLSVLFLTPPRICSLMVSMVLSVLFLSPIRRCSFLDVPNVIDCYQCRQRCRCAIVDPTL